MSEQFKISACLAPALAAVLVMAHGASATEPYFQGLGDLPGGAFESVANAVSADGRVVVGYGVSEASDPDIEAFRWTLPEGMTGLGSLPAAPYISSEATALNADGSLIVGWSATRRVEQGQQFSLFEGFRWKNGHMQGLGDLPGGDLNSTAYGVSADGITIVGQGENNVGFEPVVWKRNRVDRGLGYFPDGGTAGWAFAVSADGSNVVGWLIPSQPISEAFRWTEETGKVPLGELPGGLFLSSALGIADDGGVIVGTSFSSAGQEAVRWSADNTLESLGDLPGGDVLGLAFDASADGSIIVGLGTTEEFLIALGRRAFIWDAENEMRLLKDVLEEEHGFDLTDWTLVSANGISADGRTIVGDGINPNGDIEAWVVHLGDPCPADFNGDGVVTNDDRLAFFMAFAFGEASADINGDGVVDAQDVLAFLTAFFFGC
jgi:probable HAF family extracellular repeat protein